MFILKNNNCIVDCWPCKQVPETNCALCNIPLLSENQKRYQKFQIMISAHSTMDHDGA